MKLLPGLPSKEKTKTGVRDGEWLRTFILLHSFMQRMYLCIIHKIQNKICNKKRKSSRSPSFINVYSSSYSFST